MAKIEERMAPANVFLDGKDSALDGGKTLPRGQNSVMGQRGSRGPGQPRGQNQSHRLQLLDRECMTVTGVRDVVSFDESEILLETALGMLTIRGSDLHVNRLTLEKGEVDVVGKIDSLNYADVGAYKRQGESLLGRLFR